jgi:polysaccharide biosynthesis transport protein
METATHLSDYLAVLRRRRKQILRVARAVLALAILLAIVLPTTYRSTVKLLIEQEMAQELVPSTVTGYVSQRIKVIETRVFTPDNLAKVAEKAGIFEQERAAGNTREIAGRMRRNIKVETISANVTDPRSGTSSTATVALNLSYDGSSPEVAQRVAQELGTLFIDENRVVRTAKAQRASGFLGEEEQRLRKHIDELEAKLADYKEKNRGQLPELMNLNTQMFERSQRELDEAERQIYALEERKVQLQSQLTLIEPHTGNSAGGRLRQVQAEYLSASSMYSPDHPDVVRLKREMDSLKKTMGTGDSRSALEGEYKKAKQDLAAAREKYADDHPDVAMLKKTVASLEGQMRKAPPERSGFATRPDNPAYVNLQTQIDTIELNLKAAREQRAAAQQKIKDYEHRLVQTPRVEQEGLALHREYESATKKYREIKQNLMGAELALELEKEQRGERYSILEAAELPDSPYSPNRRALILLGLVLGIGSGIGYASLAEYMDRTIRSSRGVSGLLRAPPLAVIPYIPSGMESSPRGA